jgi:AcrR family transcriptional regulator
MRRRDDEGRRDELVTAATRVIAREGVAAATTRRIAAEAGLPLGTLHYWFASKDDLLAAVIEAALTDLELAAAATQTLKRDRDAPDLLAAFRAAWHVVVTDEPGRQLSLFEMTTMALRTDGMSELAARQYGSYRRTATETVKLWYDKAGVELPGGVEALGQLVQTVFDGTTIAWLADPEGTDPEAIFSLLCGLLDGATSKRRSFAVSADAAEPVRSDLGGD